MMNEKDCMTDVLIREKELVKVYSTFLTEATNPELRKLFQKNLDESAKDQDKVFNAMMKNGYYTPKEAEDEGIDELKKMFSNVKSSLKS